MNLTEYAKLYLPVQRYTRTKRLRLFYRLLDISPATRVLDIGGGLYFWERARQLGLPIPQVTIVNLYGPPTDCPLPPETRWVVADGMGLPFADQAFDISFCNSVIEHVGEYPDQARFAAEVRRVASSYFVQTPNWRFPIEPHWVAPFVHWLAPNLQRRLARNFTLRGLLTRPSEHEIDALIRELRLMTPQEASELFPGGSVVLERFLGLGKSIVAFKSR